MANTYTSRYNRANPAAGDNNWNDEWYRNQQISDATMGQVAKANFISLGGNLSNFSGLNADLDQTKAVINGTEYTIGSGQISFTAAGVGEEQMNWVYVDHNGNLQVSINPPTNEHYALINLVDVSDTSYIRDADLRQLELGGGGQVDSVVGTTNEIDVDSADPENPIISISPNYAPDSDDYLHVQEQQTSGTDGGSKNVGDNDCVLNTVIANGITGASLASNLITLPAGTYDVIAHKSCFDASNNDSNRLYIKTSGGTILLTGEWNSSSFGRSVHIAGRITLASTTQIKMTLYSVLAEPTVGLGKNTNQSPYEVYGDVKVYKRIV